MREIDYSRIIADPEVGLKIAKLYMDAPVWDDRPPVRAAYDAFVSEVEDQYRYMIDAGIKVTFTDDDPYPDARAMFADASRRVLKIYKSVPGESHPYLSLTQNDHFRAVHDYFGHFGSGRGFDRHGEEAAWVRHSVMFSPLARRAMTMETRGQTSAFIWINGGREFPVQKFTLLPEWVSEIKYSTV